MQSIELIMFGKGIRFVEAVRVVNWSRHFRGGNEMPDTDGIGLCVKI